MSDYSVNMDLTKEIINTPYNSLNIGLSPIKNTVFFFSLAHKTDSCFFRIVPCNLSPSDG